MICRHCGKEYSDEFSYCPYCAEPKPKNMKEVFRAEPTEEEQINRANQGADGHYFLITLVVAVLWFVFGFVICMFLGWYLYPGTLGNDAFRDDADTFAIIAWLVVLFGWIVLRCLYLRLMDKNGRSRRARRFVILDQYAKDSTSICPNCGSHNIKVYRKGYDYKVVFWGSIAGVRGSGYAGNIGANTACCRCQNCGNDWETDYDYRLIDK